MSIEYLCYECGEKTTDGFFRDTGSCYALVCLSCGIQKYGDDLPIIN